MQMEMEQLALTTDEWNIGSGDPMKDILGKGLIVHQGHDFTSQPSGNAGAR
jgi:Cu-Zn family superoxide dismutase